MWHTSKNNSSSFHWYHFCIMYVTHDRAHCHWRWQCHFPLFASFVNRIKASLPNNAMVWLQRLPHLIPGDHFLSWNLNDKVLATSPCDPEDHIRVYLTWINACSSCLGNYLAIWWARTCRTCSTAVSFALKSEVDNVGDVGAQKAQDRK